MDFQSLSRKELQTLCKKNKIPANMTNVAMADSLKGLESVEGLEELTVSENAQSLMESPQKTDSCSPVLPPTCRRTSARRRPVKDPVVAFENEHASSLPPSRVLRGTRRSAIKDLSTANPAEVNGTEIAGTPMTRNYRKPAPGTSVRRKTATHVDKKEEGEEKDLKQMENPVLVYSTRRSLRLSKNKASESIQKNEGRTEVIKIAAMSEEEAEDLEGKSKEEGSERSDRPDVSPENKTDVQEVQEEKGTDDAILVVAEIQSAYSGDFHVADDGVCELFKSEDLGPEDVAVQVSGDIMDLDHDQDMKIEDQNLENKEESDLDPAEDDDKKNFSHELIAIQDLEMRLTTEEEFNGGKVLVHEIQSKVHESSLPPEICDLGPMKESIQVYPPSLENQKCNPEDPGCGVENVGEKLPENPELLECEKSKQDSDQLVPNAKNATDPFPSEVVVVDIELENENCAAFVEDDHDSVSEYNPEAAYLDVAATILPGQELPITLDTDHENCAAFVEDDHDSVSEYNPEAAFLDVAATILPGQELPITLDTDHVLNQKSQEQTPRKSNKKATPVPKMIHILDYNKENIDNGGRNLVVNTEMRNNKPLTEKENNKNNTRAADSKLINTSLRQLRKIFKEQLQISDKVRKKLILLRILLSTGDDPNSLADADGELFVGG
ncbi:hypothetical protein HHK36_000854 [Tetracentron sinense]|uniref:Uncharacterized protein n=1 Tax=Tetracentron sinense TaxID=13715 RepID=A0A835A2J7_TETSI|nr:hypothetical protein HHK36_000854 [Tetracentron sinense]